MRRHGQCVCSGKHDADDVTRLEQMLNRVQRDLGGQVGSFRLKGARHRFTGRSSVVAFADGMWGGDYALKFYADLEAAQTEFAIYRQAPVRPCAPFPARGQPYCVCIIASARGRARGVSTGAAR